MKKILYILLFSVLSSSVAFASSSLIVTWVDGDKTPVLLDEISMITFPSEDIRVVDILGAEYVYACADVFSMEISELTANCEISGNETILSCYPNPAQNELFVTTEKDFANYTIYSVDGKMQLQGELIAGSGINVQALNMGMYFLQIDNQVYKFMKE